MFIKNIPINSSFVRQHNSSCSILWHLLLYMPLALRSSFDMIRPTEMTIQHLMIHFDWCLTLQENYVWITLCLWARFYHIRPRKKNSVTEDKIIHKHCNTFMHGYNTSIWSVFVLNWLVYWSRSHSYESSAAIIIMGRMCLRTYTRWNRAFENSQSLFSIE